MVVCVCGGGVCVVVVVGVACSFTKLQHGGLLLMLMSAGETGELEFLPSELRSCVKVEVDVLGSPSLIVHTISVPDVQQH